MIGYTLAAVGALMATVTSASPIQVRAAPFHAPEGTGNFTLLTLGINGPLNLPFHVGAGLNSIYGAPQQASAYPSYGYTFNASTGDIYTDLYTEDPNCNVYFTFAGTYFSDDGFPPGYSFTGIDVGGPADAGLSFAADGSNEILASSYAGKVLAVCDVAYRTSEHGSYPTLLWREEAAKPNATCADVKIKAIF